MKIAKEQLKQIIKEELKNILKEEQYETVPRAIWTSEVKGQMEPLSKEELQSVLPNERIADPMIPATFSSPDVLIPLGKKDGFSYFKTEYGPILRIQI